MSSHPSNAMADTLPSQLLTCTSVHHTGSKYRLRLTRSHFFRAISLAATASTTVPIRTQAFDDDEDSEGSATYTGPSSANSFLRRAWERFGRNQSGGGDGQKTANSHHAHESISAAVSIFTNGDREVPKPDISNFRLPSTSETSELLRVYVYTI